MLPRNSFLTFSDWEGRVNLNAFGLKTAPLIRAGAASRPRTNFAPRCSATFTITFVPNLVVTRGFAQTSQVAKSSVR